LFLLTLQTQQRPSSFSVGDVHSPNFSVVVMFSPVCRDFLSSFAARKHTTEEKKKFSSAFSSSSFHIIITQHPQQYLISVSREICFSFFSDGSCC
jgi:hypothetical protein